jgi:hypothetical protein
MWAHMRVNQDKGAASRADILQGPEECTCLAIRQAARHITQFYDQHLAPAGLRITQFSILAKLRRLGPMTINALADELVMDRTTLGRNILPLVREGLLSRSSQQGAPADKGGRRAAGRRSQGLEPGANTIRNCFR